MKLVDLFKRYWGWLIAVAIAIAVVIAKILGPKPRTEILDKAREQATILRTERDKEHQKLVEKTQAKISEIQKIEAESDEAKRLQLLANIANRNKG
jgi:hypothetical protein